MAAKWAQGIQPNHNRVGVTRHGTTEHAHRPAVVCVLLRFTGASPVQLFSASEDATDGTAGEPYPIQVSVVVLCLPCPGPLRVGTATARVRVRLGPIVSFSVVSYSRCLCVRCALPSTWTVTHTNRPSYPTSTNEHQDKLGPKSIRYAPR